MKAKAFLVLAVALCVLALGYSALLTADHPVPGTGGVHKSSGDGSLADPFIPVVSLTGSTTVITGTVVGTVTGTVTSTLAAGESHIGEVGGASVVLNLTAALDTTTYADGDTLFQVSALPAAARTSGGRVYLQSVLALDEDDQGIGFDLIFLNTSTTLGTTNDSVGITDTNARNIVGRVSLTGSDFYDLGGSKLANLSGLNLMMSTTGTSSLYVGGVSRGAGTYSAAGLKLKLGFKQD